MHVRSATEKDIDALVALNGDVQGLHVALFPDRFKETDPDDVAAWFRSVLETEDRRALVACEHGVPVGYMSLRIKDRQEHAFCKAHKVLYVDQISVSRKRRNRGVGRALIEAAKAVASNAGIGRLELDVWTENTEAKQIFSSQGFTTFNEVMKLEL
jgi:ribosomal protein S18 acetylase RimI-like enzyme